MSIKAVHLEMVSNLTTDAFIAALQRFVSRRGLPSYVYCDNPTNHTGAANRFLKLLLNPEPSLIRFSQSNKIEFHFNVPMGPHLGGLYEAAVKSFKYHFKRVCGLTVLTQEEFQTLTLRIEAVLNSRPLTPLSSDHRDLEVLTPGHLLVGRPLTSLPEKRYDVENPPFLQRWTYVEFFAQAFWERWHLEYLHTLQERSKWLDAAESVREGTLVLIHDAQAPPLSWKRGRITKIFPDTEGNVRVAEVRKATGVFRRPVIKLYPLPMMSSPPLLFSLI